MEEVQQEMTSENSDEKMLYHTTTESETVSTTFSPKEPISSMPKIVNDKNPEPTAAATKLNEAQETNSSKETNSEEKQVTSS